MNIDNTLNYAFNYADISIADMTGIIQKIKSLLNISGDNQTVVDSEIYQGEQAHSGFCFRWDYCANTKNLTIVCDKKPAFIPVSLLNEKIDDLVFNAISKNYI
jgi:hypothetical protein